MIILIEKCIDKLKKQKIFCPHTCRVVVWTLAPIRSIWIQIERHTSQIKRQPTQKKIEFYDNPFLYFFFFPLGFGICSNHTEFEICFHIAYG